MLDPYLLGGEGLPTEVALERRPPRRRRRRWQVLRAIVCEGCVWKAVLVCREVLALADLVEELYGGWQGTPGLRQPPGGQGQATRPPRGVEIGVCDVAGVRGVVLEVNFHKVSHVFKGTKVHFNLAMGAFVEAIWFGFDTMKGC